MRLLNGVNIIIFQMWRQDGALSCECLKNFLVQIQIYKFSETNYFTMGFSGCLIFLRLFVLESLIWNSFFYRTIFIRCFRKSRRKFPCISALKLFLYIFVVMKNYKLRTLNWYHYFGSKHFGYLSIFMLLRVLGTVWTFYV